MPKRIPQKQQDQAPNPTSKRSFNLFAKHNRGLLLDVVVFIANIFLMRLLTTFVIRLFNQASENDPGAKFILIGASIAMWVLPAAGAVMKRWHFHRRLGIEHKPLASAQIGCLFNPIMY